MLTPQVFRVARRYIYCDDLAIHHLTVFDILRGAKKLNLTSLVKACHDYLESHLSVNKVCDFLEKASDVAGDPFIMQCMYYIWHHAKDVLESKGFTLVGNARSLAAEHAEC